MIKLKNAEEVVFLTSSAFVFLQLFLALSLITIIIMGFLLYVNKKYAIIYQKLFFKGSSIMPEIADMHTHSLFSHDSVCPIEEMCLSQIQKGTNIFAVTDHCDVYLCRDCDVFTPIIKVSKEAKELNKKYGDKCLILSGVEISEGFWFPEECKRIYDLVLSGCAG